MYCECFPLSLSTRDVVFMLLSQISRGSLTIYDRLGRGAPIVNNPGNLRFRKLILADKERYISTSRHVVKEEIARKILNAVEERGGRFLRKLETEAERRRYNVPEGQNAWVEANDAISVQKVKQALREHKSGESRAGSKRREPSPRSELLSKKQKPPPKETPAGLARATEAAAAAVTTESKRPGPGPDSGIDTYSREQSHYQGGMASFSTSPIPRFPGQPMGEDYPHQFQLSHPYQQHLHPQQGPPPPHRSSFYPNPEHEAIDPYGYPPRQSPYYIGGTGGPDTDATAARRHHAVYSMMDAQARAYRVASLRAAVETGSARDRMRRPAGMPPPPPGQMPPQQPQGAPFVSPAGPYPQFGSDPGYSPTHGQHATDQGGYPPYYSLPPIHDPYESNEMRAHHEYIMGRPPPLSQQGYAGPPTQHQHHYPEHLQHEEQQGDRFSPIAGRQQDQEPKGRDAEEQKAGIGAERSRSSSSLSSIASAKKPAAKYRAGPEDEQE